MELHKQLLTKNDCYQAGRTIVPKGVMVHSTGANNPRLSRYVAPDDGVLGTPSSRHWNQGGTGACVHAFIGKTAAGGVAVYQTLPWTMRGWHAGKGAKGSANDTHISFEICEDGLEDRAYFEAVYQAAVELTAPLNPEELERCAAVRRELGSQFCRRCGYCAPCTVGIDIPNNFLMANYLRKYDLADWARGRYAGLAHHAGECVECGACESRCPYQLPIREMLKGVAAEFGY